MGMPIIKKIITTFVSTLVAKILAKITMVIILILVAHGSFIFAKDNINGVETSYGKALAQAVKNDTQFIQENSGVIIESISNNFKDFQKELGK